jgi:alpha-L-rhamnosidase
MWVTAFARVSTDALTTEMAVNPLGVENPAPRLSWKIITDRNNIKQTSYHILVASSPELLESSVGDVWDSGVVKSDQSTYVEYAGAPLRPATRYWWKVNVMTNKGKCGWSGPAMFQTGFPEGENSWGAEWIGGELPGDIPMEAIPARYLRKSFSIKQSPIKYASLYIVGLGIYEAYINGHRLGDGVLLQAPTEYFQSVRYDVHDIGEFLRNGNNTIGVTLGNGRHTPERMRTMRWFGFPRMYSRLEIVYADGSRQSIYSDSSWKMTVNGPIRANSEFDGEIYDARLEMSGWAENGYDDSSWSAAPVTGAPGGKFAYQLNPPIRIMDAVTPKSIKETSPGTYVLDMGQNMVGWLHSKFRGGKQGQQVNIRFAETLNPDGSLYIDNLRSAKPQDTYIFKGTGEESWAPRFTYHGFRYAEISGLDYAPSANEFMGMVVHDEMANTGSFSCSNDVINQIYKNARWGIRGNYRGMPTDCPQRDERLPWLGDRTTGAYGEAFPFGNHLFYAKWLDDIRSTQKINGGFPDIAPNYWDCFSDNMTWPAAYFTVADMIYMQYGDVEPIRKHYPAMKRWLDHMKKDYMDGYIIERDEHGDWCVPPERPELIHTQDSTRITNGALLASSHLYYLSHLLAKFARLAGHENDVVNLIDDADKAKYAFNKRFFSYEDGYYANNTVTSNLLPLRFGMVPDGYKEKVMQHIVNKTEQDFGGHISVGVMGVQHIMRGLSENGCLDLAYKIATNTDYPSWGYMAENGATTIWELWNGNTADPAMNSGNHVMLLGDLLIWEYSYLAGISNAEGSCGYRRIKLKPYIPADLDHVECSYESIYGTIGSSWHKMSDNGLEWNISIPANTTAEIWIPQKNGGYKVKNYKSGSYTIKTKI